MDRSKLTTFAKMMVPKSVSSVSDRWTAENARTAASRLKFAEEEKMSTGYNRGRGRGRGWAQNDEGLLPRPGQPSCSEDVECTNLINIVDQIKSADLEEKATEFINYVDDKVEETVKNITDKLYEHAIGNREFGKKLIMLYLCPILKENSNGSIMWKQLISNFQTDYERKLELRQKSVRNFHNVICLFSEYLLQSTGILEALHIALLNYLEMLLETASMDDIKVFTEQVTMHGPHLCANMMEKMDELMITARHTLLRDGLLLAHRQMLLYTIDLVNHNCKPLPKDLQMFHELQLGKSFIQRNENSNGK